MQHKIIAGAMALFVVSCTSDIATQPAITETNMEYVVLMNDKVIDELSFSEEELEQGENKIVVLRAINRGAQPAPFPCVYLQAGGYAIAYSSIKNSSSGDKEFARIPPTDLSLAEEIVEIAPGESCDTRQLVESEYLRRAHSGITEAVNVEFIFPTIPGLEAWDDQGVSLRVNIR